MSMRSRVQIVVQENIFMTFKLVSISIFQFLILNEACNINGLIPNVNRERKASQIYVAYN